MANPGSVLQQIGESFEDIGKDIARETVQAPKDIVGTALESVGLSTGGKKNPKQSASVNPQDGQERTPVAQGPSDEVKRAIARAALEELSGKKPAQQQESVWEKIQKEEEQKKEMEKKQKEQARRQALPQATGKRPRGDLYGKKAKQTNMENKAKRQD